MSDHLDTIARIEELARKLGDALRQNTAREKRDAVKRGRKLLVECFKILEEARASDQKNPETEPETESETEPEAKPETDRSTVRRLYSIERRLEQSAQSLALDELVGPSLRGYFHLVHLTVWDPVYLKATRPRRDIGNRAMAAQSFAEARDRRIEAFLDVLGLDAPDDEEERDAYRNPLLDGSTDPILIKRKKPK